MSAVVEDEVQSPVRETRPETVVPKVLAGKKALVTGGSRGIGRATVLALAEAGADVAINYRSCKDAAEEVCRTIRKLGVGVHVYHADLSSEEETQRMTDAVLDQFGGIDILVNNAGITRDKTFLKMTRGFRDEVLAVNLTGTFTITLAAVPGMVEAGWGRVINLTSVVGPNREFRPDQLLRGQGRTDRFHHDAGPRGRQKGRDGQCRGPGLYRDGHDQGPSAKSR